jgi:molecular chaperone DnaJ
VAEETDFYALLGVARDATDDQLKKAYRKVARELHPDANPGDKEAEERFKQVTLAYEVLRDPDKRARYDQFGIDGIRGSGGGAGGGFGGGFDGMNLGDIFDAFFGGGAGPFGQQRRGGGPPRGQDMEMTVALDFETAVFGGTVDVTLRLPVACDTCDGTGAAAGSTPETCGECGGAGEVRRVRQSILGQVVTAQQCPRCAGTGRQISNPCPSCHGEGLRTQEQTYSVDIPAGIDHGQTLRLTGKGAAGPRGGTAGDLYLHINVKPHDQFGRQGNDLVHALHIPFTQATLGAQLELETLDGTEEVSIEPGTQTGKMLRFRGRGVPRVDGRGRGDLVVQVFVDTPTKLGKEEEDLLRQLAAIRNEPVADDQGFLGKIKDAFR